LAKALAAELLVLHVVRLVPADLQLCPEAMGFETVEESLRRAAEVPLERMRAEASAAGVPVQTDVVVGRVRPEIVRVAREAGASLIVMGTSGREGLHRTLFGSITEWVVGNAPCPVWTVRHAVRSMAASTREEIEPGDEQSVLQESAGV
jgi:nucleotide-binding universal stress UspA family protein